MADDAASLVVQIRADQARFQREMSKIARDASRAADRVEKQFQAANSNVARSFGNVGTGAQRGFGQATRAASSYSQKLDQIARQQASMGNLGALVKGFGAGVIGGAGISGLTRLLDTNTKITNSLKVAGLEGENLTQTYQRLGKVAMENGADFESLATLFARVTQSAQALGTSQAQNEEFTRRMAVGLRASGTDAQQASDGIRQLTQALASGLLRGDEFNSVMENLPVVANAIAKGFGVTTGELRKMAEKGELDAKRVFAAFMKGSADFDQQAAKTSKTVAASMQNLSTAVLLAINQIDQGAAGSRFGAWVDETLIPSIQKAVTVYQQAEKDLKSTFDQMAADGAAAGKKLGTEGFGAWLLNETGALGQGLRALGVTSTLDGTAQAVEGVSESLRDMQKEVFSLGGDFTKLTREVAKTGDVKLADEIFTAVEQLNEKVEDGIATAEDFNKVIDLMFEAGGEKGNKLGEKLQAMRDKTIAAQDALRNALQPQVDELIKALTSLGDRPMDILDAIEEKFKIKIPEGIRNTLKAIEDVGNTYNSMLGSLMTGGEGRLDFLGQKAATQADRDAFAKTAAAQAGAAVDAAESLLGKNEKVNPEQINAFLRAGGQDINSAATAWCAAFVNSALKQMGISGTGSLTATDFARWGVRVEPSDVQRGDVLVQQRGAAIGQPGGHVGFATGQTRFFRGRQQLEMVSGNAGVGGQVQRAWTDAGNVLIRRATDGISVPADKLKAASQAFAPEDKSGRKKQENKDMDEWLAKGQQALELKQKDLLIDKDITASDNEKAAAKEREKLIQDGLNAVMKQYGEISAENRAKVIAMADAMSQAGLASDNLATKQEEAAKRAKENQQRIDEFNQAMTGIAKTAISGFVNDLRNGVSAADAFTNVLDRVIDGLINMTIEAMFAKNAIGGATGGAGGLFGIIGKIFGFGMHEGGLVGRDATFARPVSPRAFVGAKRYHSGGVVGMMPGEVPAILQRGETVIPRGGLRKTAGTTTNNQTNNVAINVDSQGNATLTKDDSILLGKRLNYVVQQEITRQQRAGGLLAGTGPGAR